MKRRPTHSRPEKKDDKALARIAGLSAVSALIATAPGRIERLFFDERSQARIKDFCGELARAHKPYRLVPPEELDKIAGTPMHGGIVAFAQAKPVHVFDTEQAKIWARDGKLLLLLDGIGNPHNLGAIVRTAAFFGIPRIVLSEHPAQAAPSDASYRVAEGGFEYVEIYRALRFAANLKELRQAYRVIAAAPGKHTPLPGLRASDKPFALVLGNEEDGLPRATLNACEETVAIPGARSIQSLNVAATAAILVYAMTRG